VGIFVTTVDASTVIVASPVAGTTPSIDAGAVKVLAFQSSKKKPIVFAISGSAGVTTVTVVSVGGCVINSATEI